MTGRISGKRERLLGELYRADSERADAVVFGRKAEAGGRGFLSGGGLDAFGARVGGAMPFRANMPAGMMPAALRDEERHERGDRRKHFRFPGKDPGLVVLDELPMVAETPEHLLDDDTTPTEKFYVRNNGLLPDASCEPDRWTIRIHGEVDCPVEISLGELKSKFQHHTYRMVLECGGNGRAFLSPATPGVQWTNGGAGCAEWTGVRLADVLKAAGVKPSGIYTAHYSTDLPFSGDPHRPALSRGVRMEKAMDPHSLIVWAMNGAPLTHLHGGPVRLVFPGWTGSASQKWLTRIEIRDCEHDGPGMTGWHYRVPGQPVLPGDHVDARDFRILEAMPVRSIITSPANGTRLAPDTRRVELRGAAWAGEHAVRRVELSYDFGSSWHAAALVEARNRFDWHRWTASMQLPTDGYYEIWSRASDSEGAMQPLVPDNWNPHGYAANPVHRVGVLVG